MKRLKEQAKKYVEIIASAANLELAGWSFPNIREEAEIELCMVFARAELLGISKEEARSVVKDCLEEWKKSNLTSY